MTLTQNLNKIKKPFSLLISAYILFLSSPAFAIFTKANETLTKVHTGIFALAVIVVTLAATYIGYKILWGGSTIKECLPLVCGTVLIGAAPQIAKLLL